MNVSKALPPKDGITPQAYLCIVILLWFWMCFPIPVAAVGTFILILVLLTVGLINAERDDEQDW